MSELLRPTKEEILEIHKAAITRFGGLDGVRDAGLLESALAQPFQTFEGKDLYPALSQKAARFAYGIVSNHPFVDGNKRTATAVMATFLRMNNCHFKPQHDDLLATMMGVAEGVISFDEFNVWVDDQIQ